jgi:hypothetical protein
MARSFGTSVTGYIEMTGQPAFGRMADENGISVISCIAKMVQLGYGRMARNFGINAASNTGTMGQPRSGLVVRKSGTGKASRLPKRSTLGCANGLRAPDFIFVVFLIIMATITYSVLLEIGIFVDLPLRCAIIKTTAEHKG